MPDGLTADSSSSVSVIIPTFNGSRWVRDAIDSVLGQTYANLQVIVVNDGSTDDTHQVLASYGNRILCVQQLRKGVSAARNTGIRASQGKYIAFLDHDDLWLPDKLTLQVATLENNPDVAVVFCNYTPFGNPVSYLTGFDRAPVLRGIPRKKIPPHGFMLDRPSLFPEVLRDLFAMTSTILLRKECFDTVGLYDEEISGVEDWHMCLRLARRFRFAYVDMVLAQRREHATNLSHQNEGVTELINVLERLTQQIAFTPQEKRLVLEKLQVLYYGLAYTKHSAYNLHAARNYLLKSLQLQFRLIAAGHPPSHMLRSLVYLQSTLWPASWIRRLRLMRRKVQSDSTGVQ